MSKVRWWNPFSRGRGNEGAEYATARIEEPHLYEDFEIYLRRLSGRQRQALNELLAEHTGSIGSLAHVEERFRKLQDRLKNARTLLRNDESMGYALRQASWAHGHAKELDRAAEHLERHLDAEHRDLIEPIRRIAEHGVHEAGELKKLIAPHVR